MTDTNLYAPYTRDYRPMQATDIAGATRGLNMHRMTVQELRDTIAAHEQKDAFASKVIVEAAHRELDRRWVQREAS